MTNCEFYQKVTCKIAQNLAIALNSLTKSGLPKFALLRDSTVFDSGFEKALKIVNTEKKILLKVVGCRLDALFHFLADYFADYFDQLYTLDSFSWLLLNPFKPCEFKESMKDYHFSMIPDGNEVLLRSL